MRKPKTFQYVIDNLTTATAEKLKLALKSVDSIVAVKTDPRTGILEIQANRNVGDELAIACEFAGVTMRTAVKKRGFFG